MRVAHITDLTGPQGVSIAERDAPTATDGQVLIDVHAAGINFPDLLMTRGEYQVKPELPFVPGSEIAGVVVSAPADSGFATGERVAAFTLLGGIAEQALTSPEYTIKLPDNFTFAQGAALPMNYLTMEFALLRRGSIKPTDTVLIHGAAGGIGTAGIQIAKAVGATVIAVASTAEKRDVALAAGADHAIEVAGFRDAAKQLTGGRGVDIVVDPVGGDRFTDSLRSLQAEGRLLVIGFTDGEIPTVKVNRLLLNNIDVRGVGWGAFAFARPGYIATQWASVASLIKSGAINPPVGNVYPLDDVGEAIAELGARRAHGKVVVAVR
ncbi:MAG: NADPH:quinone oxidoreductase family protein [Candidatus Nanopelagicales bacterium]